MFKSIMNNISFCLLHRVAILKWKPLQKEVWRVRFQPPIFRLPNHLTRTSGGQKGTRNFGHPPPDDKLIQQQHRQVKTKLKYLLSSYERTETDNGQLKHLKLHNETLKGRLVWKASTIRGQKCQRNKTGELKTRNEII